jgi:hypothetical protein
LRTLDQDTRKLAGAPGNARHRGAAKAFRIAPANGVGFVVEQEVDAIGRLAQARDQVAHPSFGFLRDGDDDAVDVGQALPGQ